MCPNETKEPLIHRLREKHAEGLLLWELENGFEMSPKQSALVFETAKGILLEHHQMERGKVAVVGLTFFRNLALYRRAAHPRKEASR